ncbi:MAG: YhjD/YihY/BrkB family envelope integrity protein [Actinomycetota bacterium]|nr:YhjD/YihY/BrkB family envelope integrity protein [Actinomycetota bacterium]
MNERLNLALAYGRGLAATFTSNRATLAAGGLAYFVALALAPAAVALGCLAGLVLDPEQVRSALQAFVDRTPGTSQHAQSAIEVLVGLVDSASASSFTITTIVSVAIAVYAASKVVLGLRQALDALFGVTETRAGLVERGISAVITLVGLVIAVGLVVLITVLPSVLDWIGLESVPTSSGSGVVDWLLLLGLVYLAVRWLLHHGPNGGQRVPWSSPGVILAALWIVAVTGGVGIYARFSGSLGAAVLVFGAAVVLLLWLYLCFLGLLWGAAIEASRQRRGVSGASPGAGAA